ncbi:hypothetical protein [Frankia canadensis]|uniref:hypothetical protein n=1 Tax=Frankia canadensis TaxID=1836972 RepID=UPI000C79E0B6|nr:hypothetical protein [Frankia canadensis]
MLSDHLSEPAGEYVLGLVAVQVYQTMTKVCTSMPNGTVRSMALGTRLRACPTLVCCSLVALTGSLDRPSHRVAPYYPAAVAVVSTVNSAGS